MFWSRPRVRTIIDSLASPVHALFSCLLGKEAGQALASRPDLLPSEYLEELQKLQDNVPTFSNEIAFRIVEKELNKEFGSVFELVEPEPVAGEND